MSERQKDRQTQRDRDREIEFEFIFYFTTVTNWARCLFSFGRQISKIYKLSIIEEHLSNC